MEKSETKSTGKQPLRFSVLIPAYNAAASLRATLDSVLAQTIPAHEVLVYDDGSTDSTPALLETYLPRVKIFRQPNQGVARARNFLCAQAQGEFVVFVDADDLWHPRYLEVQAKSIEAHPGAAAYFTEHEDLAGGGTYRWLNDPAAMAAQPELIGPKDFLFRYDKTPLSFQMSCCCFRRNILPKLGSEPFRFSGTEDTFFHNRLPLLGPIAHTSARMAVYRISEASLSSNRLKISLLVLEVFGALEQFYKSTGDAALYGAFRAVYAARRRNCGRYLMGAERKGEARKQFLLAAGTSRVPASMFKSIGLYGSSWLPQAMQARWLAAQRGPNGGNLAARQARA